LCFALTALVIVVLALIAVAIGASVDAAAKVAVKAFSVHRTAGLHTTPLLIRHGEEWMIYEWNACGSHANKLLKLAAVG
jgi:hypothetical protein